MGPVVLAISSPQTRGTKRAGELYMYTSHAGLLITRDAFIYMPQVIFGWNLSIRARSQCPPLSRTLNRRGTFSDQEACYYSLTRYHVLSEVGETKQQCLRSPTRPRTKAKAKIWAPVPVVRRLSPAPQWASSFPSSRGDE